MLEEYLVQTCYIVTTTRNTYGDYVLSSTTQEACRFRYITTTRRESHNEVDDSDAMIWLIPSTVARVRSIIKFEDVYYQVERINKARKLGSDTVEFVKCDLKIVDLAIS